MTAFPGPSVIPDRVLAAMALPMTDLYNGPILDATDECRAALPGVAETTGEAFIIASNGHGAWQMAVSNTLARGDKVLVAEAGRFATIWGEYTAVSDIELEILPGDDRTPVDPVALEARLRADTDHEIRAVLTVQTDTASSVRNDIPALRAAMDAAGHPALLMVDNTASMGCEPFYMDEWGVDVALAGCQKGMMVPPGIAFVWANEKALRAYERADMRVGYLDWGKRLTPGAQYLFYAGTPPMPHIFALREALRLMAEEGGNEAIWRRHAIMARAVRAAVEAWSTPGGLEFNILDEAHRSDCVTAVRTGSIDSDELRSICEEQAGLGLGVGIGDIPAIRIAHMGHLNPPMILGTLATIEAALHTMRAPMGSSGVAAAATVIGAEL